MSVVEDGSFQIATTDADNDFLANAPLGAEPIDVGLNVSSIGNKLAEAVAMDFVNLGHRLILIQVVPTLPFRLRGSFIRWACEEEHIRFERNCNTLYDANVK